MEPFSSEQIQNCPRKRLQFEPIEEKLLNAAYEAQENMIEKGKITEMRNGNKKKRLRKVESRDFNQCELDFTNMTVTSKPSNRASSSKAVSSNPQSESSSSAPVAPSAPSAPSAPVAPAAPAAPSAPAAPADIPAMTPGRQSLLASITGFNKNSLKKTSN